MISIRARLALWYASVLAVSLVALALAGYAFVARESMAGVDQSLVEAATAAATALDLDVREYRRPRDVAPRVAREFRFRDLTLVILDRSSGRIFSGALPAIVDSARVGDSTAPPRRRATRVPPLATDSELRPILAAGRGGAARFATIERLQGDVRVIALPHLVARHALVVGAVHPLAERDRLLRRVRLALLAGLPLVLLVATGGGYLLARKSLRPVALMTERAARIGANTMHERLPTPDVDDELGRLATVFNALLARLASAFDQQRQFITDASHELRTPVAILRGEAELALSRGDRTPDELRSALAAIRDESTRLQGVVTDLFLLARADAGERMLTPTELYLGELASECVHAVRSLAAEKGITLTSEGSGDLPFRGGDALLRRMLLNLLDNAIKYTPRGGTVALSVAARGRAYAIEVSDTGRGIPPEARERLFDRFYRAARVRTAGDAVSGAGLGLAIARWIAEAHGGSLDLTRSDDAGSTFTVTLPAPARPPATPVHAVAAR
jgi:two-component system OmpR family sensor kinase